MLKTWKGEDSKYYGVVSAVKIEDNFVYALIAIYFYKKCFVSIFIALGGAKNISCAILVI